MVCAVAVACLTGCTSDQHGADERSVPSRETITGPGPGSEPPDLSAVGERAAHTATTLRDGRVLIAGGCVVDGCGIATDQTALVAANGRSAVAGPAMSSARSTHTASLLPDGRVLLVGGFPGEGVGVTGRVDVFDPRADRITALSRLRQARGGHAAVTLDDGRVLVVGGWVAPQRYTSTVELIDPISGEASAGPPLPWAADALEAARLADGRVLVVGGQVASGVGTREAAVFDPVTGRWSSVGSLATPRFKHVVVNLPDGRVLVLGGTPDDDALLASTEIFDPGTGRFEPGPTMHEGRYKLSGGAVLLDDGRVLVGGGGTTLEVLDLAAGASEVVDDLGTRASFATVNLLRDGRALVVGGYDDRIDLVGLGRVLTITS
jgi:hypothetical protein